MKKTSKLLILAALGILIFSFTSSVAALEVTKRLIEDWLDPNYAAFPWGEQNWAFPDFYSRDSWLACKMGFPFPKAGIGLFVNDLVYENSLVIGDTIIDGYLKERALSDGTALITLHLDVKNAPLTVYNYMETMSYFFGLSSKPQAVLGEEIDAYIDYTVLMKFIIPHPGAEIPKCTSLFSNFISFDIHGIGYGTITEHAVELGYAETAGALGMVIFHQKCLFKPDFDEDHPNYMPNLNGLYPIETVEIHELS